MATPVKRSIELCAIVWLIWHNAMIDHCLGQDWPQWGGTSSRNNTPSGKGIPIKWHPGKFDRRTGQWNKEEARNIKWVARLGSQSYGNPVVADGRVYVGTNNGAGYLRRYPSNVDLGCLLCFRESDGEFLWQYSSEKLITGRVHDWPLQGIVSAPLIQGNRLWFVNNRGEVVCADAEGFYDDEDDGPEQGLRGRLFTAVPKLTRETKLTCYRPTGMLLRAIAERGGIELPRYFRVVSARDGGHVIVTGLTKNKRRIAKVDFVDNSLRISRIVATNEKEEFEEVVSVGTDLLVGIDDGRLTPMLRSMFANAGSELPQEIEVRTLKPQQAWGIRAVVGGVPQELQLRIERGNLVAYKLIATNDKREADVVWKFDMMKELDVSQHNMATCTITSWENTLFVCTSNGVDESHLKLPSPEAPSFIAMNKHTGRVLWTDNSPGANILHGQWSAPAVAVLGGVPQVIFCGGDGWVYSFRADRWQDTKPELLWKFDANPKASEWILGGRGTRNNLVAIPVIHDGLVYVVVGQDPEHGEGDGHLWCIDPTKRGDVSPELVVDASGKIVPHRRHQAAVVWKRHFQANASIWDGLDDGAISDSLRTRFQEAGTLFPDDYKIKTVAAGQEWIVTATIHGKEAMFRLKANAGRHYLLVERKTDETVKRNPNSAVVWHYDRVDRDGDGEIEFEEEFHRGISSVAIKDGLLFVPDFSGLVHCLDAKTGKPHWTCDMYAACWGSPLIVEDKVYIGDEDGDVAIFHLSADWTKSAKESEVDQRDSTTSFFCEPRHEIYMPSSVYSTPIVANNVLYIADRSHLFAIAMSDDRRDEPPNR